MRHLRTVTTWARRWLAAMASTLRRLLTHTREWWRWHCTRISEEHGYAETLTAVLVEVVELLTESLRWRYLAHELLAVYVAVLRALRRADLGDGLI